MCLHLPNCQAGVQACSDDVAVHPCCPHLPTQQGPIVQLAGLDGMGASPLPVLIAFPTLLTPLLSFLRPANKDKRLGGLYFVGASTRPGNGVPLCLIGAKLTAERVLKDLGALRS